jgi:hypothetical protein
VRGFQLLTVPGASANPGFGTVCEGINNLAQVTCGSGDDVTGKSTAFIGSPSEDDEEQDDR